jgi:uncharacterized membrane protein
MVKVGGIWSRVPSIILALAVVGALGVLGYTITNPRAGEKFTEFYILGLDGKAIDYPEELVVGEEGKVIAGIINWEQETATYWVEVAIEGAESNEVGIVTLGDGEKWEGVAGFALNKVGDNQKVEFLLYRQGWNKVYQRLHLWVDVH